MRAMRRACPAAASQVRQRPRKPSGLLQSRWNSLAAFCSWHLLHTCASTRVPQCAQTQHLAALKHCLFTASQETVGNAAACPLALCSDKPSELEAVEESSKPQSVCRVLALDPTVGSFTGPRAATRAAVALAWQALQ